jgi:hypothetical protein
MLCRRLASRIVAVLAAGGVVACSEDALVAPGATHHKTADVAPVAGVSSYGAEVPLAYYELSLAFTKRTAGFTPPVQSRA